MSEFDIKDFDIKYEQIASSIQSSPYVHQFDKIRLTSSGRPVILYGAGEAAGIIISICLKNGLDITAICDSNKRGQYEKSGVILPLISPEELVQDYHDSSLIITSWKYESEIRENLEAIGFARENIFSFWYPQRITPKIFKDDYYNGYKWAYNFYSDDVSKQLVIDRIGSYLASIPLKPNISHKDSVIPLDNKEVFLDGGAFDGAMVKRFVDQTNGNYRYIYALEPDTEPFLRLEKYAGDLSNTRVFNAGLDEKNGSMKFYYDGLVKSGFVSCKYFATTGESFSDSKFKTENKEVYSIDTMINNGLISHMPTLIHLDVQGSEIGALRGASRLIQDHKPRLVICAYHKVQDVYELPQAILNIRGDYKFALRQSDFGYYETVLYAY